MRKETIERYAAIGAILISIALAAFFAFAFKPGGPASNQ
jgi:uncharacterized membrane protein YukC